MKLSEKKCRIVGVRLGELQLNFIDPSVPAITTKCVLVREDGSNSGSYTLENPHSEKVVKAVQELVSAIEEETLGEVFEGDPEEGDQSVSEDKQAFSFPTLGGKKSIHQI